MITNWIGRVLGRSGTGGAGATLPSGLSLSDVATPTTSVIDSDELAAELARARRYEHDLSLVVLSTSPLDGNGGRANGRSKAPTETKLPQMVALLTAIALRELVRCSDIVCYQSAEDRFVLALTESEGEGAQSALERIGEHFRSRLRLGVRAGVAQFPADAYTLEELVSAAAERVAVPDTPRGRARRNGQGWDGERRRNGSAGGARAAGGESV